MNLTIFRYVIQVKFNAIAIKNPTASFYLLLLLIIIWNWVNCSKNYVEGKKARNGQDNNEEEKEEIGPIETNAANLVTWKLKQCDDMQG